MKHFCLTILLLVTSQSFAESLSGFIQRAINDHPNVQLEASRLDIAKSQAELADEQYLPTFAFSIENPTYNSSSAFESSNDTVTTLSLTQPIYTWGRLDAGSKKASLGIESQGMTLAETKLKMAQQVVSAWGEWYLAVGRIAALETSLQTHQELQNSVTRRAEKGASSPSEVRLSEARLSQTQAQLATAKLQEQSARVRLSQLVGINIHVTDIPTQNLSFYPTDIVALTETALEDHPSMLKVAKEIQRSIAEADERRASYMPEVYVRAEYQNGDNSSLGIDSNSRIMVGIQSNFSAGFSMGIESRLADQTTHSLRVQQMAIRRQLIEQIQMEFTKLESIDLRLNASESSLLANKDIAKAFNRQYLAGKRSWVEVMNTARELSQSELQLADLRAEKVVAQWNLSLLVNGLESTISAAQ